MSLGVDWAPPADWLRVRTVDLHTGGEPLRVVVDGFPELAGDDQLARRRDARCRFDHLRRALMWEPRGHADMYGCLITPPVTPGADFGVLFLHNEGYSTMCGHAIIAIAKLAVEGGLVEARPRGGATKVRIDTPAGPVTAWARAAGKGGGIGEVRFENVPSYVVELNATVAVPELGPESRPDCGPGSGEIRYDLAFGGAYYAFVDAASVGVGLDAASFRELIRLGGAIKRAVASAAEIRHPYEPDLGFLYGVVFTGPGRALGSHSRNVCVFAEGEVDRCPTGTGVSARLAIHHARGELEVGEEIVVESILGTTFSGRVKREVEFGPHRAVVPEISGTAHVTGRHEFLIDPEDPLAEGFLLR